LKRLYSDEKTLMQNSTLSKFRKERKMRDRPVIRQFFFITVRLFKRRMYRSRFKLIRENIRSKKMINDSRPSYVVKKKSGSRPIHCFSSVKRIGSRSQQVSGDSLMNLDNSAKVPDERHQNEEECEGIVCKEKQS
jgi:hypothetical protein